MELARRIIIDSIIKRDGEHCAFCNKKIESGEKIDIDHKIPTAKGGKDIIDNLRITHSQCHMARKKEKLIEAKINIKEDFFYKENQKLVDKINKVLKENGDNRSKTAEVLKTSRRKLNYFLKRYQ